MITPLSERVRLLRQKRGWTQEQLGQKAGLPAPNLARLESGGRPPSLEKLEKIAQALGVPLYVLFLEDERSLLGAHEMPRANTVSLHSHRDARFARRLLELATRLSPERRADLLAVIQTMLTDRAAVEEKGPTLKNRADQLAQK